MVEIWDSVIKNIYIGMRVKYLDEKTKKEQIGIIRKILPTKNTSQIKIETIKNDIGFITKIIKQNWSESMLKEMIEKHESIHFELKSTFYVDKDKSLDLSKMITNDHVSYKILETIVAFMNTEGGEICIGVNDDKTITGLDDDGDYKKYEHLEDYKKWDEFKLMVEGKIKKYISEPSIGIYIEKVIVNGKNLCVIHVRPSLSPRMIHTVDKQQDADGMYTTTEKFNWALPIRKNSKNEHLNPFEFMRYWKQRGGDIDDF